MILLGLLGFALATWITKDLIVTFRRILDNQRRLKALGNNKSFQLALGTRLVLFRWFLTYLVGVGLIAFALKNLLAG
jgi:hypothetical protein